MIFLETSPAIDRAYIAQIEKELAITFPSDFVLHYLQYNGGYPEADTYKWANNESTTINAFYSFKYEGFDRIESVYENLVLTENHLPLGIVPFATDDGGNFFCISVRNKDYGKVYYFNNDHFNVANPETALTLLEETFARFIENLS